MEMLGVAWPQDVATGESLATKTFTSSYGKAIFWAVRGGSSFCRGPPKTASLWFGARGNSISGTLFWAPSCRGVSQKVGNLDSLPPGFTARKTPWLYSSGLPGSPRFHQKLWRSVRGFGLGAALGRSSNWDLRKNVGISGLGAVRLGWKGSNGGGSPPFLAGGCALTNVLWVTLETHFDRFSFWVGALAIPQRSRSRLLEEGSLNEYRTNRLSSLNRSPYAVPS